VKRRGPQAPHSSPVVFGGCSVYREPELSLALSRLLEPLGGLSAFVSPGQRVLLKPNFLFAKPVEQAVTTHPLVIQSIARMVRDCGAQVWIGDAPGFESTERVATRLGLTEWIAGETGIELVSFGEQKSSLAVGADGSYRSFQVATPVCEADVIINLPKLKTHGQVHLTMGVKNILGCVCGLEKAQWHLRAGEDRQSFGRMLLQLHDAVAPELTILDGVIAMEGNGPTSGTLRNVGLLAASASAPALDLAVARLVGYSVEQVPTLMEAGLSPEGLVLERLPEAPLQVAAFVPAALRYHVQWLPSETLRNMLRRACTGRPDFSTELCTGCNQCVRVCPAKALEPAQDESQVPKLDLSRCIRCYCCQEMCPAGAIRVRAGWAERLLSFCGGGAR